MNGLAALGWLDEVLRDRIYLALALSVGVFFLMAMMFAAAVVILRAANFRKAARWERLEAAWRPLIEEVVRGARSPDDLWKRVRRADRLYFVDCLLRTSRRAGERARAVLIDLAKPYLPSIAVGVERSDPEFRARAVHTLATLGLPAYEPEVVQALNDPSELVAMAAARGLAHREHGRFIPLLLARLHRFEVWSPRFLAGVLAEVGPGAAPALRACFADAARPLRERVLAAEALRLLHDAGAAATAVQVLGEGGEHDLTAASLALLERVGGAEHLPAVRPLCAHPDFVIRAHAVSALGRLGTLEDRTILRRAVADESPWVALRAAGSLRAAGETDFLREFGASEHPRAVLVRQVLAEAAP